MLLPISGCCIELIEGDITRQTVDAIVNAANAALAGGGGVDGAIHRAAGPALMEETRTQFPDGCPTGSAVATSGGRLPAKHVFHTVGPVWAGGQKHESQLLAAAIVACLNLAIEHDCRSIAFPAISTGVYGYPMDRAADISIRAVHGFLVEHQQPPLVRFVLFSSGAFGAFARVLESLA